MDRCQIDKILVKRKFRNQFEESVNVTSITIFLFLNVIRNKISMSM